MSFWRPISTAPTGVTVLVTIDANLISVAHLGPEGWNFGPASNPQDQLEYSPLYWVPIDTKENPHRLPIPQSQERK